ncbi:LapA family protein [Bacillus solitudinis]|uniref:LapA family protein n=1 Tax=Bacillus solitudinis TaxID=2014074 RepID=UPI000C238AD5|nr:lipopolysaccharide assembly protein LapA domain-containing protein [Bacillus solitudinis]
MKGQWGLIGGILAAIIIAVFAVINVEAVRVNYLFGVAEWPLILVILGSVFMGAIIAGALSMVRIYQLQSEVKRLRLTNSKEFKGKNETKATEKTLHTEDRKLEKNTTNN